MFSVDRTVLSVGDDGPIEAFRHFQLIVLVLVRPLYSDFQSKKKKSSL